MFNTFARIWVKREERAVEKPDGMGRSGGGGPADRAVDLAPRVRTDGRRTAGPRLVVDELAARPEVDEWPQPTTLAAPVLHEEPIDVPVNADAGHRPTWQRIAELGEIARRNLRAAEEARRVIIELYQRLEAEVAVRALMQRDNAVLNREVMTLRDEDGSRLAQLKSRLIRDARAVVAHELEEATAELDRLRLVVADREALLDDFRGGVRNRSEDDVETGLADATRPAREAELERDELYSRVAGVEHEVEEPEPAPAPAPEVSRREAMAELTSLAATTSRDSLTSRPR